MARPTKETVDYYPHFVKGGRTIFILESKYGNDGYAFWFKLLEILGDAEGHYYDCSRPNNWAYLLAKTRCDEDTAKDIINTLLTLDKIDGKLWNDRQVIWCQHFVDNVSSVYKMRHAEIPTAPTFSDDKPQEGSVSNKGNLNGSELIRKETDIVKESIVKESIGVESIGVESIGAKAAKRFCPPTLEEVKVYVEDNRYSVDADRFVDFYASKGWMVGKNKMKDWRAAVRNWAKRDKETAHRPPTPNLNVNDEWS